MVYDITSPNYVPKVYIDIFTEMLSLAVSQGLISDDSTFLAQVANNESIENTMILDFSAISQMISYVFTDLTKVHSENDIDQAVGYVLDNQLKIFLSRNLPSFAIGMATFGVNIPKSLDIDIPVGTVVSTSGSVPVGFTTTADMILGSGFSTIDIPVECNSIGQIGNILAGDLDTITSPLDQIDTVTNLLNYTGGVNVESDNSYRTRGYVWKFTLRKGNYDAFTDALAGVPSLAGYNLDPWWRGYGTTQIIVDPPITPVINLVSEAINSVAEVDEDISIFGVELVPIDIIEEVEVSLDQTVPYTLEQEQQIQLNIIQYLTAYINGGYNADGTVKIGMGIGQDFIPFLANSYVQTQVPEAKNFVVTYPVDATVPVPIGQTPNTGIIAIEANQKAQAGAISISVV